MLVVGELEEPFVPQPDDLMCNLSECRKAVVDLLEQLPNNFAQSKQLECALGPALQVGLGEVGGAGECDCLALAGWQVWGLLLCSDCAGVLSFVFQLMAGCKPRVSLLLVDWCWLLSALLLFWADSGFVCNCSKLFFLLC